MRTDSEETTYDGQGLKGPGYWIVEKLGLWLSSDDLAKLLNFVETGVVGQN